jgi:soluble lytic murein transglycosylase-like protein
MMTSSPRTSGIGAGSIDALRVELLKMNSQQLQAFAMANQDDAIKLGLAAEADKYKKKHAQEAMALMAGQQQQTPISQQILQSIGQPPQPQMPPQGPQGQAPMPPQGMPPQGMPPQQMAQAPMPPQAPPQGMADGGYVLPEDSGIATLPVASMDFAEGGIVGYADGGAPMDAMSLVRSMMRDDEEDADADYLAAMSPASVRRNEYAQYAPTETEFGAFGEAPAMMPMEVKASRQVNEVSAKEEGKPAKSVRQETTKVERPVAPTKNERPAAGKDFQQIAIQRGMQYDLDPKLVSHVLAKETGGLKDRAAAVSPKGAMGVMQLMPGTAKEMGVKDPYDPIQNIEGGIKYLAKMDRKYNGDPRLTAIAYNWGPGNTDRWLAQGGDFTKLPKETRGYVTGLAEGGSVQHYDDGGLTWIDRMFPPLKDGKPNPLRELLRRKEFIPEEDTVFVPETGGTYTVQSGPKARASVGQYTDESSRLLKNYPKPAAGIRSTVPASDYSITDEVAGKTRQLPEYVPYEENYPEPSAAETKAAAPPPENSTYDELRAYFTKNLGSLEEQRSHNKNMALLSAGLGMMAGTSPHALANIGAGGEQGVKTYAASQKDLAAQQQALMTGRLGLEKYQSLRDIQKAQLDANTEYRQGQKDLKEEIAADRSKSKAAEQMTRMEAQVTALAEAQVNKAIQSPAIAAKLMADPSLELTMRAKAKEQLMQNLYKNPSYRLNFQKTYGVTPEEYFAPQESASKAGPTVRNW